MRNMINVVTYPPEKLDFFLKRVLFFGSTKAILLWSFVALLIGTVFVPPHLRFVWPCLFVLNIYFFIRKWGKIYASSICITEKYIEYHTNEKIRKILFDDILYFVYFTQEKFCAIYTKQSGLSNRVVYISDLPPSHESMKEVWNNIKNDNCIIIPSAATLYSGKIDLKSTSFLDTYV